MKIEKEILKKKLTKDQFEKCSKVIDGDLDLIEEKELFKRLYEIYTSNEFRGEMPIDVQKARTETPDEWLITRLSLVFKD